MTAKEKLGRKILDLIEENEVELYEKEEIVWLNISDIRRNPEQPRVTFDKKRLRALAKSIKKYGLVHPVIVKPYGNEYMLVSGERRLRALRMLNRFKAPAIVRDYNSLYLAELAILENLQKQELSPVEEAIAYQRAMKNLEITQAELADKIGKSRSYITNIMGLLRLPISVINDLNRGLISQGHARVISKIDDDDLAIALAAEVKEKNLNVRRTEELARMDKGLARSKAFHTTKKKLESNKPILEEIIYDMLPGCEIFYLGNEIKIRFRSYEEFSEAVQNAVEEKRDVILEEPDENDNETEEQNEEIHDDEDEEMKNDDDSTDAEQVK